MAMVLQPHHPSSIEAMRHTDDDNQTPLQPSLYARVSSGYGHSNAPNQPSTGSSQQQRGSSPSSSSRGARKGKNAPKKQPQRGLGVAQLEKLRIEEQTKQQQLFSHQQYPSMVPDPCTYANSARVSAFGQQEFPSSVLSNAHYLPQHNNTGVGSTNLAYSNNINLSNLVSADLPTLSNRCWDLPSSGNYCNPPAGTPQYHDGAIAKKPSRNQEQTCSLGLGMDPAISNVRYAHLLESPLNLNGRLNPPNPLMPTNFLEQSSVLPLFQQQEADTSAFLLSWVFKSDIDKVRKERQVTSSRKRPWELTLDLDLNTSAAVEESSGPDCTNQNDKAEKEEDEEEAKMTDSRVLNRNNRCSGENRHSPTTSPNKKRVESFSNTGLGGAFMICMQPDLPVSPSRKDYTETVYGDGDFLSLKLSSWSSFNSAKSCNMQTREKAHVFLSGDDVAAPKQPHLSSCNSLEQVNKSHNAPPSSLFFGQYQLNDHSDGLSGTNLEMDVRDKYLDLWSANEEESAAMKKKQEDNIDLELRLSF